MARKSFSRERRVATCGQCGLVAAGVTTVEHWPWGHSHNPGSTTYAYHVCDDCHLAATPRPLSDVLLGFAPEF